MAERWLTFKKKRKKNPTQTPQILAYKNKHPFLEKLNNILADEDLPSSF